MTMEDQDQANRMRLLQQEEVRYEDNARKMNRFWRQQVAMHEEMILHDEIIISTILIKAIKARALAAANYIDECSDSGDDEFSDGEDNEPGSPPRSITIKRERSPGALSVSSSAGSRKKKARTEMSLLRSQMIHAKKLSCLNQQSLNDSQLVNLEEKEFELMQLMHKYKDAKYQECEWESLQEWEESDAKWKVYKRRMQQIKNNITQVESRLEAIESRLEEMDYAELE